MFMVELDTDSYYSLLGVEPDATAAEIRQGRDRLVKQLRERQRRESTNREELVERQKEVNAAGEALARPAQREKYDREHAHLRFFTVRVVHRALSEHLRQAGVAVSPLSDLDRVDFGDDLTPNPILDGAPGPTPAGRVAT
jgi:curved DNA-binding protein CbpA